MRRSESTDLVLTAAPVRLLPFSAAGGGRVVVGRCASGHGWQHPAAPGGGVRARGSSQGPAGGRSRGGGRDAPRRRRRGGLHPPSPRCQVISPSTFPTAPFPGQSPSSLFHFSPPLCSSPPLPIFPPGVSPLSLDPRVSSTARPLSATSNQSDVEISRVTNALLCRVTNALLCQASDCPADESRHVTPGGGWHQLHGS